MQDWTAGRLRYLIHFDDGGSGMRMRGEPLDVGSELNDGGSTLLDTHDPKHERTFWHAWAQVRE